MSRAPQGGIVLPSPQRQQQIVNDMIIGLCQQLMIHLASSDFTLHLRAVQEKDRDRDEIYNTVEDDGDEDVSPSSPVPLHPYEVARAAVHYASALYFTMGMVGEPFSDAMIEASVKRLQELQKGS